MHKTSKHLKHKKLMCLAALAVMLFSAVTASSTETNNYFYDDMSRLIRVEHEDGTAIEYVYDNMGNRMIKGIFTSGVPSNTVPNAATNPTPADDATGVYVTQAQVSFTSGGDPDGDEVVHYVYMGLSGGELSLVASGSQTTFPIAGLETDTTYCWEVVTRDTHYAETTSSEWCFTTESSPITLLIPTHYSTIQEAIDEAGDTGYEIKVPDGTYNEDLDFKGKAVRIFSVNGADSTTIDGSGSGSVVTFDSYEDTSSILDGFTITGGSAAKGGGILCDRSAPSITNCKITGNNASMYGGGIYCIYYYPTATITKTEIFNNTAGSGGGAYFHSSSTAVMINCAIFGNYASTGGGIYCNYASPTFINCTVMGNVAAPNSAGVHIYQAFSYPQFVNSILWHNSPKEVALQTSPTLNITYSDIEGGYTGTGNINEDPLFVGGSYYLSASSPCKDQGTDDTVTYPKLPGDDIEGDSRPQSTDYDMGADEIGTSHSAVTLTVPDNYTTIQAAINAAEYAGNEIMVKDGTYNENISFNGKMIKVYSENGPDTTVIKGTGSGSVVTFNSKEGRYSVLDGFTVKDGSATYGGGIYCNGVSYPVITGCKITSNYASYYGGGVYCSTSRPLITDSEISGNSAYNRAGGVYLVSSSASITNSVISNNSCNNYGGGFFNYYSSPIIKNSLITGNSCIPAGGGIYQQNGYPTITNCTITENTGGIQCYTSSTNPQVSNTILWSNSPAEIVVSNGATITVTYSDIQSGHTGTGNIDADPLFVSPTSGNYSLSSSSPCIDAANSNSPAPSTDMDDNERVDNPFIKNTGTGSNGDYYDMGAFESATPSSVVAYWKFEEGSGTVLNDNSSNSNDGVLINSPLWSASISGGGLIFDGSSNYVNVADDDSLDPTDALTIEAWINPDTAGESDFGRILSKYAGSSDGWDFFLGDGSGSGKKLGLKVNDNDLWSEDGSVVGVWHHVAVVYEATVGATFYVDGVAAGTDSGYTGSITANNSDVQMGKWPNSSARYFDGIIDEVVVYNQTLSNSQVYSRFIGFDDGTDPTFSGIYSATDAGTGGAVDLSWSAASDPTTITYSVFYSSTSGGQNFSSPNATTTNTSYQVTGLTDDQIYYFVVRANDVFGNEDTNTVEKSATPTAP